MRKVLVAAAFVALSTSAAFAASTPLQATLAAPATERTVVASSIAWRCEGTSCVSASAVSTSDANACRGLAKAVGSITGFTSSKGAFDDAKLAKCNGK